MVGVIIEGYANHLSGKEKYSINKKKMVYNTLNDVGMGAVSVGCFWLGSVIKEYNEVMGSAGNIYPDFLMGVMPIAWYMAGMGAAAATLYDFGRNVKKYKQLEIPENI